MIQYDPPSDLQTRIINTFGNQGQIWLNDLPRLIKDCETRFNCIIKNPLPNLSYNYVVNATCANGQDIIIKFCVPTEQVNLEIEALISMQGDGMVKLLQADADNGILLLEKLSPGKMLSTLTDDDQATEIAASVMQKLWRPIKPQHLFPTTAHWFARLNESIDLPSGFSKRLIEHAQEIAFNLHQNMSEAVLLHGDCHHFNILSAQRQPWLAIDPKGVVGEPEYDVGALLRNPIPVISTTMNTQTVLSRRVTILAERLGFDQQKISHWGFAQAVLAAVWCVEAQSTDWQHFHTVAVALDQLCR